jgi:transcriptional regulator with PAS, ATPase and Fis domain
MVEEETFRKDLYYRISTFPIHLPALADRREDISLLADTLLKRINKDRKLKLHPEALFKLELCSFPGNIRELRNILERASLMTDRETIMPEHLILDTLDSEPVRNNVNQAIQTLDEVERHYLQWASASHQGDRRSLAKILGISERTLYRKVSIYGLLSDKLE